MKFTYDWFSGNIPNWKRWLAHLIGKPYVEILEIGCFEGKATVWLLQNVLTHGSSSITVVDTFDGGEDQKALGIDVKELETTFRANIAELTTPHDILYVDGNELVAHECHSEFNYRVHIIKSDSWNVRADVVGNRFDMVYVDGSHLATNALHDCLLAFHAAKQGGLIICDDYEWDVMPGLQAPKSGIDAFISVFADRISVEERGYQVLLRKL
ncbi:MAG: class I SAM-dependent methyltransferase [Phycisphaerae bacterium]